jgi:hypothetical protein
MTRKWTTQDFLDHFEDEDFAVEDDGPKIRKFRQEGDSKEASSSKRMKIAKARKTKAGQKMKAFEVPKND